MDYPEEWDQLPKRERKKLIKKMKKGKEKNSTLVKKLRIWGIVIVVTGLIVFGGYYWWTNIEILPPASSQGHSESSPQTKISDEPMSAATQSHMLEHSDGNGLPGVIINYNCKDFECESDLIDQLTEIAKEYPEFVYLAPYPSMSKKIAITREGDIETFDSFDKESLTRFISGR